jgi:hypothetical protein
MVDGWVWDSANRKSFIIDTQKRTKPKGKKKSRMVDGSGIQQMFYLGGPSLFLFVHLLQEASLKKKSKDKVGRSLSLGLRFFGLFYKNLLHIILTPPGRYSLAQLVLAARND